MSEVARFAPDDTAAATAALRRDGAVVIDGLAGTDRIDALRDVVMRQHPEFADKSLLTDFNDTGKGRFVAPVTVTEAVLASGVLTDPHLKALVSASLADSWVFEAVGLMMTLPGAPRQANHRDSPVLFPETPLAKILPAFALTVSIPLVDVGPDNGPTAILVGTHRYEVETHEGEPAIPEVPRGSIAMWNFSTMHWGMPNTTDAPRPALYLTVCRPFWSDRLNFDAKARARLVIEPTLRERLGKRFVRAIDAG